MDPYGATSSTSGNDLPGRIRKRRYSTARIQPTRIKKVMQSDEEIGRMIASVPVAIGSVMEHFAEKLLEAAANTMHESASKTLSPAHVCTAINRTPYYSFLQPLIKNFNGTIQASPATSSPVTTPTNGFVGKPFDHHPLGVGPYMDEKSDMMSYMKETSRSHPTANILSSSDDNGGVKRRRGRPRKEDKDKSKLAQDSSIVQLQNGNNMSNTALDSLLMPPPSIVPMRRAQPSSLPSVIIPKSVMISNATSSPSSAPPASTPSPQQQPPDAISA